MAILDIKDIKLSFGGLPVLDGIQLRVEKGERICLMGRNGEGKSTLLRLLSGALKADSGEFFRQPGIRVSMLSQEVPSDLQGTIMDIVMAGFTAAGLDVPDFEHRHLIEQTITRGSLDPEADFGTLSTGNKRRTLLARAMVVEPDVLLLDEPTNHLDIDAIAWLESELARFKGSLFFVTHDRAFLRALAKRIIELDRGCLRDWDCDYATFLRRRDEVLEDEKNQNAKFDRKLAEEEAWIVKGVRARRTRNEGRVRALLAMRDERRERRMQTGNARLTLQDSKKTGKIVIEAENLSFSWPDKPMVNNLSTIVARGDKIGILGPNGSGKTTLLKLLLGELAPSLGTVEHGTNLQVAYYDQQRMQLDETKSVMENITDGGDTVLVDGRAVHIVSYLKNFLFSSGQARSPITHLSGGERNRLLLARLFTQPANVLVMDEPTNDLDIETVELLEELLLGFSGTLLLVSHDREFLDNVTTSTLVLEGEGNIAETVGGYSDWARTRTLDAAQAREKAKEGKKNKTQSVQSSDGPRRMTWKESKELETLPREIEVRETEQGELNTRLADPAIYQDGGVGVGAIRTRLAVLEKELATIYTRWEELETLGEY
jgi:ABC transport system ATP-binding/permease protein